MRISDWSSDVCSSDLGSGNFSVIVHGLSAHAGRNPDDGRNALLAAADLALRLAKLKSPALKVNPAKIDGGGPNNVVPDSAILRVNMRPSTPEAMVEAEAALRGAVAAVSREHRSEERRVGKEGVSTCRSRGSPDH